jgi:hypothetical protein
MRYQEEGSGDKEIAKAIHKLIASRSLDSLPNMPNFSSIRPLMYTMQIDAITNKLASLNEETKIQIGPRKKGAITTLVTLDMPEHMRVEGGQLTTYDKAVLNGVSSLLETGNMSFTLPMLYGAMTGLPNPTVDGPLYEELTRRLEKMRRMTISIDLTEENEVRTYLAKDGNLITVQLTVLDGYLLPLNKLTGLVNGKKAEMYNIIQHPPLYSYAKAKHQLTGVKASLLAAPLNNNITTIPLKTYLIGRIEGMKNRKNNLSSQTILYEAIYAELGEEANGKTRRHRIRKYTAIILDHLVSQGYIKSYTQQKKSNVFMNIEVVI